MGVMIPIAVGAAVGAIAVPVIELLVDLFKKIGDWLQNFESSKVKIVWDSKVVPLLMSISAYASKKMPILIENGFNYFRQMWMKNPISFSVGVALGALACWYVFHYSKSGSTEEAEALK